MWAVFVGYTKLVDRINALDEKIRITENVAMKTLIWNGDMPLNVIIDTCYKYIEFNFNGSTQNYCEELLRTGGER